MAEAGAAAGTSGSGSPSGSPSGSASGGASERGAVLRLSEYVRYFKKESGEELIEAVLRDSSVQLTPVLRVLVNHLERGPTPAGDLLENAAQALGRPPGALLGALSLLTSLGLVVQSTAEDRAQLAAALGDPSPAPVIDQVELTNVCPMRCVMCGRGFRGTTRPLGFMDVGLFTELVKQVRATQEHVKPLALHNSGESLLHPELDRCVRIAREAGLAPELSTNPAYLPLARYRALADAGVARIVLSLDGLSPATLHAIRGPAARCDQALANVEAILQDREQRGEEQPELVIQMLRMALNEQEHAAFMQRFAGREAAGVVAFLKPLDAASPARLFTAADKARPALCRAPWRSVVVLWDGRVVPCCYDDEGAMVLGDASRESLVTIWHGEAAQRLRAQHLTGDLPHASPCATCAHAPTRYRRPAMDPIPFEPLHW